MAHWHGLAKLRMHHDLLLDVLDDETKALGLRLRKFSQRTCAAFDTKELQREYNARVRRQAKQAERANRQPRTSTDAQDSVGNASHVGQTADPVSVEQQHPSETSTTAPASVISGEHPHDKENLDAASRPPAAASRTKSSGRRRKTLNINTYKFHSYGDYARTIRMHGTMDSYSTEPVGI